MVGEGGLFFFLIFTSPPPFFFFFFFTREGVGFHCCTGKASAVLSSIKHCWHSLEVGLLLENILLHCFHDYFKKEGRFSCVDNQTISCSQATVVRAENIQCKHIIYHICLPVR